MTENSTVEDFLADYHFADSDYQVSNGTLDLTVYGTNGSPLEIDLPESQITKQMLTKTLDYEIDDFDIDQRFAEQYKPGDNAEKLVKALKEDRTELKLTIEQAMLDLGISKGLDPDMPVLAVQMNAWDVMNMLANGGIEPSPRNIIAATQGVFAGRDGYYLAGYTAKAGADELKQIVAEGKAHSEFGFDTPDQHRLIKRDGRHADERQR